MNGKNSIVSSRTDWGRLKAMSDDEIDTSEVAELGDEFFANAELHVPSGTAPILLAIDEETAE